MRDYWADNPPVHIMVAAYLGKGEKDSEPVGKIEDLMTMLPME